MSCFEVYPGTSGLVPLALKSLDLSANSFSAWPEMGGALSYDSYNKFCLDPVKLQFLNVSNNFPYERYNYWQLPAVLGSFTNLKSLDA